MSASPITKKQLEQTVPKTLRNSITDDMVDMLNGVSTDYDAAEHFRSNFIGYSSVLRDGKFKLEDYLNAVMYVSYKLMQLSNEDAYARAFPQRHARLTAEGKTRKEISSYVSAYHRGMLVGLILKQTLTPSYVLNQDAYQEAINTQLKLMRDDGVSPLVKTQAANSILNHLKQPESSKLEVTVDTGEGSGLKELRDTMLELARAQKNALEEGNVTTIELTSSRLVRKDDDA